MSWWSGQTGWTWRPVLAATALAASLLGACASDLVLRRESRNYEPRVRGCCFHIVTFPPAGALAMGAPIVDDGQRCGNDDPVDDDPRSSLIAAVESRRPARAIAADARSLRALLEKQLCHVGGDLLVGETDSDGRYIRAEIRRFLPPQED